LTGRDFLVGWVGRLVRVKDPFLLIETAKHVVKRLPSCHFVLVGDGEMRERVERAIHLAGLTGHIHLLGWRSDLTDVYSDFDLTFLTSLSEGTPLALLETMASGKPFVSPRIGGVPDLVFGQDCEDGGVRYFQNAALANREPRALSNGIVRLLLDQPLRERMGMAARQFAIARFSADRLANDLAALYSKLLIARRGERYVESLSLAGQEGAVTERP
jgi:glycosyltransferase involved in cell wall biosynthesis